MERTITVRGVPDATLDVLRRRARENRRSLNSELLTVLEDVVHSARMPARMPLPGPVPMPAPTMVREVAPSYGSRDVAPTPLAGAASRPDAAELEAVCDRWGIRRVALFGSHADGTAHAFSDVDLLVEFAAGRTPGYALVRVADDLRPLFDGKRVDLHTPASLDPAMRERAERSAVVLHDRT